MQGTYSEIYLDEAMRNMGEMIEYGEDACGLDQDLLLRIFIRSGYADRWEKGDPRVICGLSGTELCRRLIVESGMKREIMCSMPFISQTGVAPAQWTKCY